MDIVMTLLSAENGRTLILLVAALSGVLWLKNSLRGELKQEISEVKDSLGSRIDALDRDLSGKISALDVKIAEQATITNGKISALDTKIAEQATITNGKISALDTKIAEQTVSFNGKINDLEIKMRYVIKEELKDFHTQLKGNDFYRLNCTIMELTYTLEQKKIIDDMDKDHIDSLLNLNYASQARDSKEVEWNVDALDPQNAAPVSR